MRCGSWTSGGCWDFRSGRSGLTRCSLSIATVRTATVLIVPHSSSPCLGRAVKKMIGGIEGWKDEGFDLVTS